MRASEIMSRPVIAVGPRTTVRQAIHLLTEHRFAGLPVVDDDDRVLGMFTESDALASGIAEGGADLTVDAMMSIPVEVATPGSEAADLVRRMLDHGLRSMPVVDEGVLVGIVSRRDLLRPLVRRDDAIAAGVRALVEDYDNHRCRWQVSCVGGAVTLVGPFADEAERQVLTALVRTVPGVVSVDLVPAAPSPAQHGSARHDPARHDVAGVDHR